MKKEKRHWVGEKFAFENLSSCFLHTTSFNITLQSAHKSVEFVKIESTNILIIRIKIFNHDAEGDDDDDTFHK